MSKTNNQTEAPQRVEYNDAVAESKRYFEGDDLAATVWVSKYALKDSFGNIYERSPREMHERIAAEIERIERNYPNPMSKEEAFALLDHFRYVIPQGGPMTGIGNNFQVASLSNCFVIGHKNPADSYGGIFRMDEEQVQLMKSRGGVGHDLSHIRPTGSPVLNSALTSTGIVPFMERYSNSTREVAQDGRRGALMLAVDQASGCRTFHRCQGRYGQGDRCQRLDQDRRRIHACGPGRQEVPPAVPDQFGPSEIRAGHRCEETLGEDHPQCVEIGRAGRVVLGYDHPRERSRLLRRRGFRDRLDQPPAARSRFVPTIRAACWRSTYSAMWTTPSRRRQSSTSRNSASMWARPCT